MASRGEESSSAGIVGVDGRGSQHGLVHPPFTRSVSPKVGGCCSQEICLYSGRPPSVELE